MKPIKHIYKEPTGIAYMSPLKMWCGAVQKCTETVIQVQSIPMLVVLKGNTYDVCPDCWGALLKELNHDT